MALRLHADPARPDQRHDGCGLPAAVAAALRFKDRPMVCVPGDGDFLMKGQELATAARQGADLLVIVVDNGALRHDPHAPGTRLSRAHFRHQSQQPGLRRPRPRRWRLGGDGRANRRFRAGARSHPEQRAIRLRHCKTDVEQITNATTVMALRAKRGR